MQVTSLKNALYKLQNDAGPNGFEAIAGFHGSPGVCPENGTDKYACCRHGMPAFPHWHRLLTVQFERALRDKGSVVGVPYWDWTRPGKALPSLFTDTYDNNPFNTSVMVVWFCLLCCRYISFTSRLHPSVLSFDSDCSLLGSLSIG